MKKTENSDNIQIMNKFFKQAVNSALLVRGFIALNMQILLIREFLIIFNGNELTIGIILANWLILEAIGSGLIGRLSDRIKQTIPSYILLQILVALFLPISIWLLRLTRQIFSITPGEIISVFPMLLSCLFVLAPIALIDGTQFSFGCKLYSSVKKEAPSTIGKVYILEAIGMIAGGIIFTFVFLKFFNSFQIVFLLSLLSIISALLLNFSSQLKKKRIITAVLFVMLILILFAQLTGKIGLLQKESIARQWDKANVVAYENSIYGNVTVVKNKEQYTFFSDGVPIVTTPTPDISSVEDFVHFPMLTHPAPKKVLVISAAAGGIINEILKYPVEKIDYAELNPLIIRLIEKFPTELTERELNDERVNIIYQDGRLFVKNTKEKYDVVLINLGLPSSLQTNRVYTDEFYKEVKKILKEKGILVVKCWGSLVYISDEQKNINASFLETLKNNFEYVKIIPGDTNIFIASSELDLDKIIAKDIKGWKNLYKIKTRLLTDFYIEYRLNPYWKTWFLESLEGADKQLINRDFSPRGLFYGLNLLYSLTSPKTKYFFNIVNKINLSVIIATIAILSLLIILIKKLKQSDTPPIPLFTAITGFSGITFQLILILGFQVIFGFLYYWIGILTSAFMVGLTLGAGLINNQLEKIKNDLSVFFKFELLILVFALLLPLVLKFTSFLQHYNIAGFITQGLFLASSIIAGILVGLEFPLANKIYWKKKEMISHTGGALYASDLIGACVGAVLIPIAFIPIIGIFKTCIMIMLLKLSSLIIIKSFK
ncbi:MAG: hypothetical protein ABH954_03930 [Candidatus Omnitrophota bacterium]